MSRLVAVAWLAVVAQGAWLWRPAPARLRVLRTLPDDDGTVSVGVGPRTRWTRTRSPLRVVGAAARRRMGRPPDPAADRRLGLALAAGCVSVAVAPALLVVVGAAWWVAPHLRRRRERRQRELALLDELPEVVDLLVLAVGAGLTVPLAVSAVARHQRGVIGLALADVLRRVALGARLADGLAGLPELLGERVRRLSSVLVASERYGVALLPALERLAADTRVERCRHAEAVARRVPVKLLFPLVLCTLPAFALLTVVPLLAGSVGSLRT